MRWRLAVLFVSVAVVAPAGGIGGRPAAAESRAVTVEIVEPEENARTWRYEPAIVTVEAGTTVVWHNRAPHVHTVAADDGSFASPDIEPGGTWRRTFSLVGEHRYHCGPHRWMRATVRVAPRS